MPVYDYRCTSCNSTYDVYHKGREIHDDVVCPSCGAKDHKRLLSAAMVSVKGSSGNSSSKNSSNVPPCESGGCCPGSCDFN